MNATAPATSPNPEPLVIPSTIKGLLEEFDPASSEEMIIAQQAVWAAAQLANLLKSPPARPDASWLRLFSLADRVLHRNLRDLRRFRSRRISDAHSASRRSDAHRTAPTPPGSQPATSSSPQANSSAPSQPPAPAKTRIAPRPVPSRSPIRPNPNPRRVLAELELEPISYTGTSSLPISISPSQAAG